MIEEDSFLEIAREVEVESVIRRSRFIARARRAESEGEARQILKEIALAFPDANHHCWAYRIGWPDTREHGADAGEPAGTAGKPILGALSRVGVVNCLVVVTRYFGGVKLGVRGLIEAYGDTANLAMTEAGSARRRRGISGRASLGYEWRGILVKRLLALGAEEARMQFEFGEHVDIRFVVPLVHKEESEAVLFEMQGKGGIREWSWIDMVAV